MSVSSIPIEKAVRFFRNPVGVAMRGFVTQDNRFAATLGIVPGRRWRPKSDLRLI